jgi:hypothetical protein
MHHRPSDVFFSVERFFNFVLFYLLVSRLGGRGSVWCLKLELTSKRTTAVCFLSFFGLAAEQRKIHATKCLDKDH